MLCHGLLPASRDIKLFKTIVVEEIFFIFIYNIPHVRVGIKNIIFVYIRLYSDIFYIPPQEGRGKLVLEWQHNFSRFQPYWSKKNMRWTPSPIVMGLEVHLLFI